jgi:hypothetical protein
VRLGDLDTGHCRGGVDISVEIVHRVTPLVIYSAG